MWISAIENSNTNNQALKITSENSKSIADVIDQDHLWSINEIEAWDPKTKTDITDPVKIDTSYIKLAEITPLKEPIKQIDETLVTVETDKEVELGDTSSSTNNETVVVKDNTQTIDWIKKTTEVKQQSAFTVQEISNNTKAVEHIGWLTWPYALKVGAVFNAINSIKFSDRDNQWPKIWLSNKKDINSPQWLQSQLNWLLNQKSVESWGNRDYPELDPVKDKIEEDGAFWPKSYSLLIKLVQASLNKYVPEWGYSEFVSKGNLAVDGKFWSKTWERLQSASQNKLWAFYASDWRKLAN